ncbi:MAG: RNA polymerase sigma factor [Planctomycetota bacterium]
MEPSGLHQRLLGLPGAEALSPLGRFDPGNDLHLDAAATLLIERFHRENDAEALALLYELCHQRLHDIARLVRRQLAVAVDPEDLVASFMTRLFVDVRRPQPKVRHFLGLAHTAMRNDARNQLRQAARATRRHIAWQSALPGPSEPTRALDEREEEAACAKLGILVLALIARSFNALGERDRRSLFLRDVEGLSYEALAQRLALPADQVGTILRRARTRLAKRIGSALDGSVEGPDSRSGPQQGRASL